MLNISISYTKPSLIININDENKLKLLFIAIILYYINIITSKFIVSEGLDCQLSELGELFYLSDFYWYFGVYFYYLL